MNHVSLPGRKESKKIEVIESNGTKSVLLNGQIYMSWPFWDTASQRMVIVQLYRSKFATQQDLSQIFDLHVNSVQKYVADFTKDGFQGLCTRRSGPKKRWKLTPILRSKILLLALHEGIFKYEAIQKRLEAWNERVSITSIRQTLLENGFVNEKFAVGDKIRINVKRYVLEKGEIKKIQVIFEKGTSIDILEFLTTLDMDDLDDSIWQVNLKVMETIPENKKRGRDRNQKKEYISTERLESMAKIEAKKIYL